MILLFYIPSQTSDIQSPKCRFRLSCTALICAKCILVYQAPVPRVALPVPTLSGDRKNVYHLFSQTWTFKRPAWGQSSGPAAYYSQPATAKHQDVGHVERFPWYVVWRPTMVQPEWDAHPCLVTPHFEGIRQTYRFCRTPQWLIQQPVGAPPAHIVLHDAGTGPQFFNDVWVLVVP